MATRMPLTASWIALLTSARARELWRVTSRAMRRKTRATSTTNGVMASTASASRQSMPNRTAMRMPAVANWLMTSVLMLSTSPNSCVSLVMRLTMRPEEYSSKNDMSWRMAAAKTSLRMALTTSAMTCAVR